MKSQARQPWKVSLHGGHCGEFCDHARGALREILEAAVSFGYTTYGVAEHAPRTEERFLYPHERKIGWDIDRVKANFAGYAEASESLAHEFSDRLNVLRGFEAEVVPAKGYAELMNGYRSEFGFDYVVGSVHYVDEYIIDSGEVRLNEAVAHFGGFERLAVRYYETVAEMIRALSPEVIGHFDVVRRFATDDMATDTPPIRDAAACAIETAREHDCILDLNTAGYRKGLGGPFPDAWIVPIARDIGVPFCFGDDSHAADQVGSGVEEGREFLLSNGVEAITTLARGTDGLERREVPLGVPHHIGEDE